MKKIIKSIPFLFVISLLLFSNISLGNNTIDKTNNIIKHVFEDPRLSLSIKELNTLKKLFINIFNASSQELCSATNYILKNLKKQQKSVQNTMESLKKNKDPIPLNLWHKSYLVGQQINHFNNYHKNQFCLIETTENKRYKQQSFELAQSILNFITFEREHILNSYQKTFFYLTLQKNNKLPEIIRFWDNKNYFIRLTQEAKSLTPPAEIQNFVVDLLIQTVISSGESLYEGWVGAEEQQKYQTLADQEQTIEQSYVEFQQNLANKQKVALQNITTAYSKGIATLDDQREKSNSLLSNEILYLNKLSTNAPPKTKYLYDPVTYDQQFARSSMLTPTGQYTWYNIFPQPNPSLDQTSDWEFETTTNAFYQYNLVPFKASDAIQQKLKSSLGSQFTPDTGQYAHNNAIFNEYIYSGSYTIQIECTLIGVSYPFFMGIIFNKARWISGVVERIPQYRLAGIYGTQSSQDQSFQAMISFAEYKYEQSASGKPTITPPLDQIIDPSYQPIAPIDPKIVSNFGKNDTTFLITIITQPTLAQITVSQNNTDIANITIDNLDPMLFLYHGIGFMAPGCQASFKIIQPSTLVYSNDQIQAFENMIKTQITNYKSS